MTRPLFLMFGALALAGCSGAYGKAESALPPAPESCKADGAQGFVGRAATADLGAELLRATGARTLRWVPPRTAVTMDYRADRLTVSYDDNRIIERISCG
ncbi:MAG TPA: I78 family peptidase inhibitor [Novosphingobium sp.]|nr:I78 family peptidase inhibitor [Novosphingobium sp.]